MRKKGRWRKIPPIFDLIYSNLAGLSRPEPDYEYFNWFSACITEICSKDSSNTYHTGCLNLEWTLLDVSITQTKGME